MDTISLKKYHEFLEFFINDTPLSTLLDSFYGWDERVLTNWIGVLGSPFQARCSPHHTKVEIIKLKQLLRKKVTEQDLRQAIPPSLSSDQMEWYLDRYREELANREIIIYCCAECGDYDCGGIGAKITQKDGVVIWTITEEGRTLRFEFDKHCYFDLFNGYMQQLEKDLIRSQ